MNRKLFTCYVLLGLAFFVSAGFPVFLYSDVVVPAPCTHDPKSCNFYQNWLPGGECCLGIVSTQISGTLRQEIGVGSVAPVDGTTQCGAKFRSVFPYPCSVPLGGCGGVLCTPLCGSGF